MNINIEAIKRDLEATDGFKLWNDRIGLTFEDFSIYDFKKGIAYKKGKEDIGNYYVDVTGDKHSAYYDFNNPTVAAYFSKED